MRTSRSLSRPLKLLMVAALLLSLLVLAPNALAQGASTPGGQCANVADQNYCIDKTASPTQVTIGQPLTFTITLEPTNCPYFSCGFIDSITDTLPAGVTFVSATGTNTGPNISSQPTCTNSGNAVTCTDMESEFATSPDAQSYPSTATIVVTPTRCGTFANIAATPTFQISASAVFTVVGCPSPPGHHHKHHHKHHKHHKRLHK